MHTQIYSKKIAIILLTIIGSSIFLLLPYTSNPETVALIPLIETPVQITVEKAAIAAPKVFQKTAGARLQIPKINVNTPIKDMGLTPEGAMAVPGDNVNVGWFSLGTRPGETGSAVIGGHNYWNRGAGVFEHLDQLEEGDVVHVVDAQGDLTAFVVRKKQIFDANDSDTGIFESDTGAHLNLITCSGEFDPSRNTYNKRLVIFTDLKESGAVASL